MRSRFLPLRAFVLPALILLGLSGSIPIAANARAKENPHSPSAIAPTWIVETIDSSALNVGYHPSLAWGTDDLGRVAYYSAGTSQLKYAYQFYAGGTLYWSISARDSSGMFPSLALDGNNIPCYTLTARASYTSPW